MQNIQESGDSMAYYTDAQKKADEKYRKKVKVFTVKYTPTDIQDALRLQSYLDNVDMSCNAYLKSLVKKDLDEKNIPYPTQD